MKVIRNFFAVFVLLTIGFTFAAFAQDQATIPTDQFLSALFQAINGFKGASAIAIAGAVVQILIKFLNTDICGQIFKNFTGWGKLVTVSALSLISGVVSLEISGMSFGAALIHSSTLAAIMVFGNQLLQHYAEKKSS